MGVFVDSVAGRAGTLLHQSVAAIGFHLRSRMGVARSDPRASLPVPRGPVMAPELLMRLQEAARTVGKLEWSRRYAEIVREEESASRRPQ